MRRVLTGHELASAADVERSGVGRMMSVAGAGGADVPMGVVVDGVDVPIRMIGASLTFTSGAAAGRRLYCIGSVGDALDEQRDQRSDLRGRRHRRRARDRQPRLARVLLLPPVPGARRQPCDPSVRRRRQARVPAAAAVPDGGAAIDDPRGRPLRSVRGEDDRGAEHERRLRVAARRAHVRRASSATCSAIPSTTQFRLWYNDHAAHLPGGADVDASGELPRERRAGAA